MRQRGDPQPRRWLSLGVPPAQFPTIPIIRRGNIELHTRISSGIRFAVRISVDVETSSRDTDISTIIRMLDEVIARINMIYRTWTVTVEIVNRDTVNSFFRQSRTLKMGDVTGQFIVDNIAMSQSAEVNNIDLRHLQINFHLINF